LKVFSQFAVAIFLSSAIIKANTPSSFYLKPPFFTAEKRKTTLSKIKAFLWCVFNNKHNWSATCKATRNILSLWL